MMLIICAAVLDGFLDISNPANPATIGVDIEVPLKVA